MSKIYENKLALDGDIHSHFHTYIKEMIQKEDILQQTPQQLFIRLYETVFPDAAAFIRKMGGDMAAAKDIFQDALVIYYERSAGEDFTILHSEKAYIMGTCKHLWYKKHHEGRHEERLDSSSALVELQEEKASEEIFRFIELSGKKCLDLLKAFYYDKLNMKDLATKFGFSGERSATVQKFKCLQKVRSEIENRSLVKEDFYE